jgi:O-antigen/teichoic acid export membrane protein
MVLNKNLIKNVSLLGIVRFFNLAFPILIVPQVINLIDIDGYGQFVFFQSIIVLLSSIYVFGANTKGIDYLTKINNNFHKKYLSDFLSTQFLLYIILLLLSILVMFLFDFKQNWKPFLFLFIANSCRITFTEFYYIVKNKLTVPVYLNFVFRFSILIGLYSLPDFFSNITNITLLYMISSLLPGVFNLFLLKINFFFKFHDIKKILFENLKFVHARIVISIKDKLGQILLGMFYGMEITAIYDIGIKIINVGAIPTSILSQYFLVLKNKIKIKDLLIYLRINLVISILSCLPLFIFSDYIAEILNLSNKTFTNLSICSSLGIVFISASSTLGNNGLIKLKKDSSYLVSVYFTTFFYIISFFLFLNFSSNTLNKSIIILPAVATYLFEILVRLYFLKFFFKK